MNSDESLRTAARMMAAFGGWGAVERVARPDENGVYVVRLRDAPDHPVRERGDAAG